MIPLTVAGSWLLIGTLIAAGTVLAAHAARWLYDDADERRDLASLDRHHGARAAWSRVGQVSAHALPSSRASSSCPAGQPYDWAEAE